MLPVEGLPRDGGYLEKRHKSLETSLASGDRREKLDIMILLVRMILFCRADHPSRSDKSVV